MVERKIENQISKRARDRFNVSEGQVTGLDESSDLALKRQVKFPQSKAQPSLRTSHYKLMSRTFGDSRHHITSDRSIDAAMLPTRKCDPSLGKVD